MIAYEILVDVHGDSPCVFAGRTEMLVIVMACERGLVVTGLNKLIMNYLV